MTLAHIVASLEARHGGPSRSVRQLAAATARCGHSVQLLTSGPTAAPDEIEGALRIRTWRRAWPAALCPAPAMAAALDAMPLDVVHEHGLWLRPLHYAHRKTVRDGIPLVISPRGMMGAWAWQHHRTRKALAGRLVHPGALAGAAGWHATSTEESAEIRALGFTQPICVAPNGVDAPSAADLETARVRWREVFPQCQRLRVAVFYSRFHQKKRVMELIDAWAAQAPRDWALLLVGVPEQYSVAQLRSYALRGGTAASNIYVFDGAGLPPPYAIASLFVLPSHTENFGLVIAEALAHGVPALVTDTTPWRALAEHDAGWCVAWSSFPTTLRVATAEEAPNLARRGAAGRAWVVRDFSWEKSARSLLDFYGTLPRR
jgi:glycosyltransferase involved in cell wall biosynthesis